MDELELLKQDWKKREQALPKLSYNDIYKMILKKSSSSIKWIFYISIIELVFWLLLNPVLKLCGYDPKIDVPYYNTITIAVYCIVYPVIIYFIYKFYTNYRKVSTTNSVKELMENILKSRKTVNHYVWFNLIYSFVFLMITYFLVFTYDPNYQDQIKNFSTAQMVITFGFAFIIIVLFCGLLFLFYRVLYGFLLRRLRKNYKELEKIEV
ncbi:hypothetical protein ACG2LH_07180 [Zhouia sp. PK063]|uniref:hypothetical protein n=1 Tax=Zhouia sp. PK063 TaxID=3373602 RepID=UPI0037970F9C